jgi:superfamily II DNA helicase RecQ
MASKGEMMSQGKQWGQAKEIIDGKYARLNKMKEYVALKSCRRLLLLDYFGDPSSIGHSGNCKGCDVCLDFKWNKATESDKPQIKGDIKKKKLRLKLGDSALESASLYQKKYSVAQIAKIRSLGVSTVMGHLSDWYVSGGRLEIRDFVSSEEESAIISVIKKAGGFQKLKTIKEKVGEEISYEQIRLVIAKMRK